MCEHIANATFPEIEVTPDAAIDVLARRLHWKMEHLDPSEDSDWSALSDFDKGNYRLCIKAIILDEPDLVRLVLDGADHSLVDRRA